MKNAANHGDSKARLCRMDIEFINPRLYASVSKELIYLAYATSE